MPSASWWVTRDTLTKITLEILHHFPHNMDPGVCPILSLAELIPSISVPLRRLYQPSERNNEWDSDSCYVKRKEYSIPKRKSLGPDTWQTIKWHKVNNPVAYPKAGLVPIRISVHDTWMKETDDRYFELAHSEHSLCLLCNELTITLKVFWTENDLGLVQIYLHLPRSDTPIRK